MGNIPIKLVGYLGIGIFAICLIIFLWSLILCILKVKNTKLQNKKSTVLISVCCIFVAAASWILNIGWLRFIMTLFLVPFIHAAVFFTVNVVASYYSENSPKLKITNLLFCITYIMAYVLYPDIGDFGPGYFFFGLFNNREVVSVVQKIADATVILHIILFVVQLVFIAMAKNPTVEAVEETTEEFDEEAVDAEETEKVEETPDTETKEM